MADLDRLNCVAVQDALLTAGAGGVVRTLPQAAPTGQSRGGVAPVAQPRPLHTIVDNDLAAFDTVWAAGGVPRPVFPTTFGELLRLTGGTPADVR